jgi:hypothetical protein
MVACLQLGAADYMIKPIRHNELKNLWARVYWWRRVSHLRPCPYLSCSQAKEVCTLGVTPVMLVSAVADRLKGTIPEISDVYFSARCCIVLVGDVLPLSEIF